MLKRWAGQFLLGMVIGTAATAATAAAPGRPAAIAVTVYADEGYPPYSYDDNGKPAGIYHDIVKAAAAHMAGYQVTIVTLPWKRGMALIAHGNGFALYPPYMNVKDEPWTWPYSLPLFDEHVVAMCRKDVVAGKGTMHWPRDFYGLTIGNNAGFIVGGAEFDQAVASGKIHIEEGRDNRTNILKLGLKRIDCYINDRVSILWTKQQLVRDGLYQEGTTHAELVEAAVVGTESGFLGFTDRDNGKYPYKDDFVKQFDTVIYQMKRRGEIDRIAADFLRTHGIRPDQAQPPGH